MNTQDLIELTTLHALGMLDDDERAAYESALEAAPPALRNRVLEEARRMGDLGDLLPDEQPTAELRELVLAAVRAAMREQEVERRIAAAPPVAGRIDPAMSRHAARVTAQPRLPRGTRVHAVWRAAAIGLAAATVALTVFSVNIRGTYRQLDNELLLSDLYDRMGAEYVDSMIFDAKSVKVAFSPVDPSVTASVAAWTNPDWSSQRLFIKNLKAQPNNEPYRLVVLDAEGNIVREVTQIQTTGEFQNLEININPATESRLAIYRSVEDALEPVIKTVDSL
jgi:hypothetical protein